MLVCMCGNAKEWWWEGGGVLGWWCGYYKLNSFTVTRKTWQYNPGNFIQCHTYLVQNYGYYQGGTQVHYTLDKDVVRSVK